MRAMGAMANDCLGLHRVSWHSSMLSANGRKLLCRFCGPDAESVRIALRSAGVTAGTVWPGTVHDAPGLAAGDFGTANVLVLRRFEEAVAIETIQALEDANIACLEMHRVSFLRSYFSLDRRRMACVYRAPDAESVRIAQRQAGMPVDALWAFQLFLPDTP